MDSFRFINFADGSRQFGLLLFIIHSITNLFSSHIKILANMCYLCKIAIVYIVLIILYLILEAIL